MEGPMIYIQVMDGNDVATFKFNEGQREKAKEFRALAEQTGRYVSMREEPLILLNRVW